MRKLLALALACGLTGLAVLLGISAVQSVLRQQRTDAVCSAAAERRWQEVLDLSEEVAPEAAAAHPEGRIEAECRCWALLAAGRSAECVALADAILQHAEPGAWIPEPPITRGVLRTRIDQGRASEAAELAVHATRRRPDDRALLELELRARSLVEGEEATLRAMEARLAAADDPALALRLVLADLYKRRGDAAAMLRVLGDEPPDLPLERLPPWFEARAQAFAYLGRADGVKQTYDAWRARGGDETLLRALYALQMSYGGLNDPEHPLQEQLEKALANRDGLDHPVVLQALFERTIAHLLNAGKTERALELFDTAREEGVELEVITRRQIVNEGSAAARRGEPAEIRAPGQVRFALAEDAPPGTLLVEAERSAPSDAPYEAFPLTPGTSRRVERAPAATPLRWVFRDEAGRTRASGATWPASAGAAQVVIEPGPPRAPEPPFRREARPGDGRRRVLVLIPDGMDWRLVQYLRTRGELPVMRHLLEHGHRAVLESDPPLTAAAMESLVWPDRSRRVTFLGLLHRVGIEVAGLASVGRNPLDFLTPALPESVGLFETIGSGDLVAANMLFSHGGIDAGQNALLTGPHGRERRAPFVKAVRPLRPEERAPYPAFEGAPDRYMQLVEGSASRLDAALHVAREEPEVDLLMLRIEAFDIATHGTFSELLEPRQDDGRSFLLDLYRYVDRRIGEVARALDEDDVLIVMSDHGIRTAMEHSKDAIFVAVGDGVPRGRAPGMPALRGVPRVLAELLEVETGWPHTGVAPWLRAAHTAAAAPRETAAGSRR